MDFRSILMYVVYPTVLTLFSFVAFLLISRRIYRFEAKKLKRLENREINDAVETESPIDEPGEALKAKGIDGLETRFAFLNKFFPIVIISLWLLFLVAPYLTRLPAVYMSFLIGIISVMAGIVLKPFLENLVSGMLLTFFQPIRIGDTVSIDGEYGLVEAINLTHTILKVWDWRRIVIPNSKLIQKEINNYTLNDSFVWAHVEFHVAPNVDLQHIKETAMMAATSSAYYNNSEEPSFWVMEMSKDSLRCWVAAWADSPADAWELKNDIRTHLCMAMQQKGYRFNDFHLSISQAPSQHLPKEPLTKLS